MWLNKIQERIRMGEYRMMYVMVSELQEIYTNALAYNAAGHGRSSGGEGNSTCCHRTGLHNHACMCGADHEHTQRSAKSLIHMLD